MAWGVFVFSKDGRARLAGVLRALLIGQLVVSLCMVIFCYNASMKVMVLLTNIHQVTVFLLYGLILLQAYGMKLHYTAGLRLIALLLKFPQWWRMAACSRRWMLCGAALPANGLLVYAACSATLKALTKELSVSLCYGISQYLTEPSWKKLLDTMQIELSCCGVDMPSNWHEIPWINMDFLNSNSELVLKLAGADGGVRAAAAPYSCCAPRVLAACYHDPLQQTEWGSALPPAASLHARGCVEAVRAPLARALLALHCFCMLALILQVVILVLFQLLRTSARDAVLRGEGGGGGAGRGALLGAELAPRDPPRPATQLQKQILYGAECANECSAYAVSVPRRKRRRKLHRSISYPDLS